MVDLTLLSNFKNVMSGRTEGFAHVARHVGCNTVAIRQFYLGKEDALTYDQQLKLASLIQDMYNGYTPKGGFYKDEDSSIKWTSKIE